MDNITAGAIARITFGLLIVLYAIMSLSAGEILLGRRGRIRISGVGGQLLSVVYALIGIGLVLSGLVNVLGGFDEDTEAVITGVSCLAGGAVIVLSIIIVVINAIFGGGDERSGRRRR